MFTGTAAHTYTVRSILIANTGSGKVTIALGIGGVAAGDLIMATTGIPGNSTLTVTAVFVMSGAETLQAQTNSTGLTITVSGVDAS